MKLLMTGAAGAAHPSCKRARLRGPAGTASRPRVTRSRRRVVNPASGSPRRRTTRKGAARRRGCRTSPKDPRRIRRWHGQSEQTSSPHTRGGDDSGTPLVAHNFHVRPRAELLALMPSSESRVPASTVEGFLVLLRDKDRQVRPPDGRRVTRDRRRMNPRLTHQAFQPQTVGVKIYARHRATEKVTRSWSQWLHLRPSYSARSCAVDREWRVQGRGRDQVSCWASSRPHLGEG